MADKVTIEKLNNDNYALWCFKMRMYLMKENCWDAVTGNVNEEENSETEIKRKEEKSLAMISLSVEDSQLVLLRNAKDGAEAWEILRGQHERNTTSNKVRLFKQIFTSKLLPGGSMEEHILKMTEAFAKLEAMDCTVKDELIVAAIMASLGEEYDAIQTAIDAWDDSKLTLPLVKGKLLEEWQKKKDRANEEVAYVVTMGGRPQKKKDVFTCFWCKGVGHMKRDCVLFKEYVKERSQENNDNVKGRKRDENDNKSAKMARFDKWYSFVLNSTDILKWHIDSGASTHMACHEGMFHNLIMNKVGDITVANGSKVSIEGKGSVRLKLKLMNDRTFDVLLEDVFYVPGLDSNLISVKKLADKGFDVSFFGNECRLRKEKVEMTIGSFRNGLYELHLDTTHKSFAARSDDENCVHEWHNIMGHRNLAVIQRMGSQGLLIRKCECDDICESCIQGKMSRKSFPKSNTVKDILDCVATDVCGPMQVESPSHSRYFITFTDLSTGYCEVYFLHSKDQAASKIKEYVERLKNSMGRKPKILRCDRGREYVNKDVQKYLADEGIRMQCTVGYAPEQNGAAERMNRTLVESARAMLLNANLDICYWAEAIKHACYVNNRVPNNKLNTSPIEVFMGIKPNFEQMYEFGRDVFVMIPYERRRKWDKKANRMKFVGFDEMSKGFRVLDVNTRKITVSRDVLFISRSNNVVSSVDESKVEEEMGGIEWNFDDNTNEDILSDVGDSEPEFFSFESEDVLQEEEQNERIFRRSTRSNAGELPRYLNDYYVYSTGEVSLFEPKTFEEAMSCPEKERWMLAMTEELNSIESNDSWEEVNLPLGRKAIGSKWVFKIKLDEKGQIARYKARLVAQGFSQKFGIDYDEVFAPVARSTTFRILLSVAGSRDYFVKQNSVSERRVEGRDIYEASTWF